MTDDLERKQPVNGGSRPVPDPTELTDRAIARLEKSLMQYVDGQMSVRDQRIDGIDEATKLRLSGVEAIPDQIRVAVSSLEQLHNEKFGSIQTQFKERDIRSERESRDNKVAVDAAFAAQKEAAAKQDEANQKAIDKSEKATGETISFVLKDVDALKIAVSRIDSTKVGATENRTGLYATIGALAAVLFAAIAVAGIFASAGP